jgi:hypothetical protein
MSTNEIFGRNSTNYGAPEQLRERVRADHEARPYNTPGKLLGKVFIPAIAAGIGLAVATAYVIGPKLHISEREVTAYVSSTGMLDSLIWAEDGERSDVLMGDSITRFSVERERK